MDKEITKEVTSKNRKMALVFTLIGLVILVSAIMLVRTVFKSTIKKSEITTSVVTIGNIENTLNATGEVLPEFEEILTSPINASIKNVVMDAGNEVKAGQSILT